MTAGLVSKKVLGNEPFGSPAEVQNYFIFSLEGRAPHKIMMGLFT